MTALLASIATRREIAAAVSGGADIVDLKNPGQGALGAWELPAIAEAVALLRGVRPVSATVGDLPMDPARLVAAVESVSGAGVDIVKIGLFEGECADCIAALEPVAKHVRVVAVFFADRDPDFSLLPLLARSGFYGAMLDTADKRAGSLRNRMNAETVAGFVSAARALGLCVGLAGSLRLDDVAPLLAAGPDFLGFRRALCAGENRVGEIDAGAVTRVRAALDAGRGRAQIPKARRATATAGAQTPAE